MRFVVVGAGAVGGVIAGKLVLAGHEVAAVARGEHGRVIASAGLRLETPAGHDVVRLPVFERVADVGWRPDDVALVAVKSQHTVGVLEELRGAAGTHVPVVCVQNGVVNEREALRRFPDVYGVCVMCPCGHVEPGVVQAYSYPTTGILDVGRAPTGTDEVAERIAAAWSVSGFRSEAVPDVMRWKYRKLILNLANAIEVLCGRDALTGQLAERARAEGEACLAAAGIDVATVAEDRARRGDHISRRPANGHLSGSSTWQSVHRGTGSVETDFLNGEVVMLGRLHGVATPANALVQEATNNLVARGGAPGSWSEAELLDRLDAAAS